MRSLQLAIVLTVLVGASPLWGSTILVGYDFDDGTGTATTAPTLVSTLASATNFGVGAGLNNLVNGPNGNSNTSILDAEGDPFGTGFGLEFGGARAGFGFTDMANANNLGLAITNNDYMTFMVSPNAGVEVRPTSFTFRTRVNQLNNSAERWALFSSVDGFANGDQIATGRTTAVGTYVSNVVPLTGFPLLAANTEFRLYIFGGNNAGSSATLFDKVIVNIPEPSRAVLLALGLVSICLRRQRQS